MNTFIVSGILFAFLSFSHMGDVSTVSISGQEVVVDIADDFTEREKGLMGREYLGEKRGMFFIHEKEEKVNYWMKGMNIPIDIIYIDKNFLITDVYKSVPPCKNETCKLYSSSVEIKYVLELQAGFCEKYKIEIGDQISVLKNP